MNNKRILLIVGGGIAAYKSCELIRLLRGAGADVTCVLTEGGAKFITALTLAALSENQVHTTLWDLKNEVEMGHIRLSREADLVVVCPASADLLAKMAGGMADDLATTLLLATDKPVVAVPAMNVRMWQHPATRRNVNWLAENGVIVMDPDEGPMACGEYGPGRLPEPPAILGLIRAVLGGNGTEESDEDDLPELPGLEAIRAYVENDEHEGANGNAGSIEAEGFGLGGLSGSLIKRKAPDTDGVESGDESQDPSFLPDEVPIPGTAAAKPMLAGGFVLARKGAARSAPPTDPDAINHTVSSSALPPEMLGDVANDPYASDPWPITPGPLTGRHVLVTAGPTHEAIDPVRYLANRSSGKQGYAIAAAAARAGAKVTLVSGPVALATPRGVERIDTESARDMAAAVKNHLPADVAIMVAAVADWRTVSVAGRKMKKRGSAPPALMLTENPDILATVAGSPDRPLLLVGFAAETDDVLANATEKRRRKGADWIIANDVSGAPGQSVMGGDANIVHIVSETGVESLPEMAKHLVAQAIVERIATALGPPPAPVVDDFEPVTEPEVAADEAAMPDAETQSEVQDS
jgi:phosphopantothenoylcysteine decarboxylase/phosphopantothenate--cysteine ligase